MVPLVQREKSLSSHASDQEPSVSRQSKPSRGSKKDKFSLRAQQKIACAECRRLKIKCDRTIPCATCVKRGCASLCPNGTIPPGDGSRFVISATDHLTNKLTSLESRMRSLEDALAISYASHSRDCHPLLAQTASSKLGHGRTQRMSPATDEEPIDTISIVKALDDFHIEGESEVRLHSSSERARSLLGDAKDLFAIREAAPLPDLDLSYLGPEINLCQRAFPFPSPLPGIPAGVLQTMIEMFLPSMDRAVTLCNTFFDHLSWMASIVSPEHIFGSLIPRIYKQSFGVYGSHDLALLLIVTGIGAMVNLDDQPYNLEAQHYGTLGKAALCLQSVLTQPSLTTVKALHLLSIFYGLSSKEDCMELSYTLLDLAGQVAIRIGLHVDPSKFNLSPGEAYDRREYFWNLLSAQLWTNLVTGRPPSSLGLHIDCNIPTEEEECNFHGNQGPRGCIWGIRACSAALLPVTKAALAKEPPNYDEILKLDGLIRSMAPPLPKGPSNSTNNSMSDYAQSNYLDQIRLYLHRPFFAQAMSNQLTDPMKSPYAKSITAAYLSGCIVLQTTNAQYVKKPALCARIWRMWSFAFTASIVVGTVAMRNLSMPEWGAYTNALEQFEAAYIMFQSAAEQSARAARALPLLEFMLHKSRQAAQIPLPQEVVATQVSQQHPPSVPMTVPLPDQPPTSEYYPTLAFDTADSICPLGTSSGDVAWQDLFREGTYMHGYRSDNGSFSNNTVAMGDMPMLHDQWASFMHTSAPHFTQQ